MKPATNCLASTALKSAARATLHWRLLLLWAALLLVPTAVLALPLWGILAGAMDYSVHAPALVSKLDALSAFDLIAAVANDGTALKTAGLLSLLLTLLLSPFLSGLTVTAARAAAPAGFGLLVAGGIAAYGRMARMLVWSAVPLGVALALGGVIMKAVAHHNEAAITEADAALASMLGMAVALVLFAIAQATVEAGRAVMAVDMDRRSAVKAWWAGVRLLARRPLAAFGVWILVGVIGLTVAALVALLRIRVAPMGTASIMLGLLLTQAAALGLAWMRNARLFALVTVARAWCPESQIR